MLKRIIMACALACALTACGIGSKASQTNRETGETVGVTQQALTGWVSLPYCFTDVAPFNNTVWLAIGCNRTNPPWPVLICTITNTTHTCSTYTNARGAHLATFPNALTSYAINGTALGTGLGGGQMNTTLDMSMGGQITYVWTPEPSWWPLTELAVGPNGIQVGIGSTSSTTPGGMQIGNGPSWHAISPLPPGGNPTHVAVSGVTSHPFSIGSADGDIYEMVAGAWQWANPNYYVCSSAIAPGPNSNVSRGAWALSCDADASGNHEVYYTSSGVGTLWTWYDAGETAAVVRTMPDGRPILVSASGAVKFWPQNLSLP